MSILQDIARGLSEVPFRADDGSRVRLCKRCHERHYPSAIPESTEFYGPTLCDACGRVEDGSQVRSYAARAVRILP